MRIIFYCQYVYGMGHLFRSIELVRSFADHEVLLIVGGQPVDVRLPDHVRMVHLPALFMDEYFTTLIPGKADADLNRIQAERKQVLFDALETFKPDYFITELYPFGRRIFEFELIPLLKAIRSGRYGKVKTICSLRDVLVEKRAPDEFENRVLDRLNRFYDQLWIHSDERILPLDETFSRLDRIRIPIHYTGFVARTPDPGKGRLMRETLGLTAADKMIVASAGGGRSGYHLLNSVIMACRQLEQTRLMLFVFTGPFMDQAHYDRLRQLATSSIRIRRFTRRFVDYLSAADLSISMAGYNTCMNLLATGVTALVYPYTRQQEQPIRAHRISRLAPVNVLTEADIDPHRLRDNVKTVLQNGIKSKPVELNLSGAANTRRLLQERA